MITADVNVLIYAIRPSSPHHEVAKSWLESALVAEEPFGLWDITLVSTYRVLTNSKVWSVPETPESTLEYLNGIRSGPAVVRLEPGLRYWTIFADLCREANVRGPLTSDAMLAALALEHRCRIATFDKDFAKFKGLQVFRPTP